MPGSVDVNDKQIEQWNVTPPLLYLWSRQDWTAKHKAIAQKCGHVSRRLKESHLEKNQNEGPVPDHPTKDHTPDDEHSVENHELENEARREIVTADHVESSRSSVDKKLLNENSRKRHGKGKHEKGMDDISEEKEIGNSRKRHGKGKHEKGMDDISEEKENENSRKRHGKGGAHEIGMDNISEDKRSSGMAPMSETCKETPRTSSPHGSDARSTVDNHRPESLMKSSPVEVHPHLQPGAPDPSLKRTGYGGSPTSFPEDMTRRYRLEGEEPYSSTIHRWSTGLDYGIRNSEEAISSSHMRGNMDNLSYRRSILERDEYGRSGDVRAQVQFYGHDPIALSQRRSSSSSSYLAGQDHTRFGQMGSSLSSNFGHPVSAADSSSYGRMNTSAMQRYAPQLDELNNHTRMSSFGFDRPMPSSSSSSIIYDPLAVPRPGFQADPAGFAPGLHHPFSKQNSSGWLNE